MRQQLDPSRRRLLLGGAAVLAAAPLRALGLRATPAQPEGPFYPVELPLDDDNDLTRVGAAAQSAAGEPTDLTGRVLDLNGRPLVGVRVEIWQCDAMGRYHHPRDTGAHRRDPHFQGHGHTLTDGGGSYRFRTIHPVPYPGRTPHIHFAVLPPGGEALITQLYVQGESRNAGDFLYRRVPPEQRGLVTAAFRPGAGPGVGYAAAFDIALGATPGA